MAAKKYTEEEIEILSSNRYVKWASRDMIKFTDEFKERFIYEYYELHKGPTEIFLRAGFDTEMIGWKRIESCSCNWRKAHEKGMLIKNSEEKELAGRLVTAEATIRAQDEEIKKLKAEIELLKKAGRLGRGRCRKKVYGKPDLVRMIDEVAEKYDLENNRRGLCRVVGLTKSDYLYRKSDKCKYGRA